MVKPPIVDVIARDIRNCRIRNATDQDLVEYLQLNYPRDYSRTKLKVLESMVRKARDKNNKRMREKLRAADEDDEDEASAAAATPSRKRKKKEDASEVKLIRLEAEHLKSAFIFSGTDSSEVSTSEDAIYGEKLESRTDLISDALRDKYVKQAKLEEASGSDKHMEVEMDKKRGKASNVDKKAAGRSKVSHELEPKKNEGPRFCDMGGLNKILEELTMEVLAPLCHPQVPSYLGVKPVAGILLHGPPGCGKTMLANAIANEAGLPFYKISATEIVSGVSGVSEENIRELFSKACRTAPSIVFIDEIDAIALKRESSQKDMGRRIVTQLMTCMDESRQMLQAASSDSTPEISVQASRHVLVIGATNHPDEIDPGLRRPGRFDSEIYLGVPDENARIQILSALTRGLKLEGSFDLLKIARLTPGYVGADLASLANKAGNLAMQRIMKNRKEKVLTEPVEDGNAIEWWKRSWLPDELENLSITMDDFEEAIKKVQPSSKREGFSTIPDVKWEDVGGLDDLRKVFTSHIVKQIRFPEKCKLFGMDFDTGFLLYGPPGCGKTLLAKAVANEAGANFIHIKGPEILNKYVGESETAIRSIFNRARTCAPCILFFDEVDSLTTKRGKDGGWVVESVAMQLMMELDGGDKRSGVYVIGATNRREAMDPAFLRPGRFGKHLYVGCPSPDQRVQILKAVSRKKPIDPDVDLDALARSAACGNFTGADLSALVHEASVAAFEEAETLEQGGNAVAAFSGSTIRMKHFEEALAALSGSSKLAKNTSELKKKKLVGGISGSVAE
uniref:AAA+ ATPase domain-containing protein n=1 Tax=Kalanchoe fedtschenkoi TaxID=63787 RepID=A0A7N0T6C3_KALFE